MLKDDENEPAKTTKRFLVCTGEKVFVQKDTNAQVSRITRTLKIYIYT